MSSLRDEFAVAIAQAIIASTYREMLNKPHAAHVEYDDAMAETAYKMADAMMRERDKAPSPPPPSALPESGYRGG